MEPYQIAYLAGLIGGCGYALLRGGAPERWGAAIVLVGMILSNVTAAWSGNLYMTTNLAFFAADTIEAIALIVLACVANRFWPLWAAMLQLDTVFTEIVMFAKSTPPFSYGLALRLFALPLPILIGIGALRYRRRLAARPAGLSSPAGE